MKPVNMEKFYSAWPALPSEFLARLDRNFDRLARLKEVNVTVVTASYTIRVTDDVIVYTSTGGHTITLPNATAFDGYQFQIKHAGSGVLTVDATSSGQLWSSLGLVNSVTLAAGDGISVIAGNSNWQIV